MSSVDVRLIDGKVRLFIDGEEITWEGSLVKTKSVTTVFDESESDKKSLSVENVASNEVASDEYIDVPNKDNTRDITDDVAEELTENNYETKCVTTVMDETESDKKSQSVENIASIEVASVENKANIEDITHAVAEELTENNYETKCVTTVMDETESDKKILSVENVASIEVASVENKDNIEDITHDVAEELTEKNNFDQNDLNNKYLEEGFSSEEDPKNEEVHNQSIPKNLEILDVIEELSVQNSNLSNEKDEVYVNENINPVKQDNFKNVSNGDTKKPVEKPTERHRKTKNSKQRQKKRKQSGYAEPKVVYPSNAEPKVVYPSNAEPKVVYPSNAEPKVVYPSNAEPKVVYPSKAESKVVYPSKAEPKVASPKYDTKNIMIHGNVKPPRAYIQSIIKALSEDRSLIYVDQPEEASVNNPHIIKIEKIGYMPNTISRSKAVQMLSTYLKETDAFIENVIDVLGVTKSIELYEKTRIVQEHGGLDVKNGSRKRTPGGVFIKLMRDDKTIKEETVEKVLKLSSAHVKKIESKVRHAKANAEIKEQLEKGGYL